MDDSRVTGNGFIALLLALSLTLEEWSETGVSLHRSNARVLAHVQFREEDGQGDYQHHQHEGNEEGTCNEE